MDILHLPLKRIYFDQIKSGEKKEEYRLVNDFWKKRIEGREYTHIKFTLGYPPSSDKSKHLIKEWKGYEKKEITHPHFGNEPVLVYAIKVG